MAKKKSILEIHLEKPLPEFSRGDADCCAWAADYANALLGKKIINTPAITFGEAVRLIRYNKGLANVIKTKLTTLPFKEFKKPANGDIIVYKCDEALGGEAVGIYHDDKAVTRFESDSLHITQKPELIICLRFS